MLKLRILLLRSYPYYIILSLALIYFFVFTNLIDRSSVFVSPLYEVRGIIEKISSDEDSIKFEVKVNRNERIIAKHYFDKNNALSFNYQIGDEVIVFGKEQRITNNTIPNTFNYKKYLKRKNIYHVLVFDEIELINKNKNLWYKTKSFLYERSDKLTKSSPYIHSLLFGNNNYLDEEVMNSYRENGISHLFAISGSHINIFLAALSIFLKKVRIKEEKRYVIIILFLIFYMFITNFPMSVVRSCIFAILVVINKWYYFYIKPIYLLFLTISIIIFYNPNLLFDVGLQYSVTISFFLLLLQDSYKKDNYFIMLVKSSLISFFSSLPITIFHFYQINFLSIVYNLLFIPLVSFIILPLVMISYVIPFFDNLLFSFIKLLEWLSTTLNGVGFGKLIFMKCNIYVVIIYYLLLIFCCIFHNKKIKFGLGILIILYYFYPNIKNDNYYMMFDVGQGDSSLLVINDSVTLIDTGGYLPYKDNYNSPIVRNKIIPYLKSVGIRKIDNLILTHGDSDHMQDALYLVNHFKVNNIYINCNELNSLEQKLNEEFKLKKLYKNDTIKIDNYEIRSLNSCYNDENNSSIVLYSEINSFKFLFLGDVSTKEELKIINEYNLNNIDILKIAHHGSKTSSDYYFLDKVNPKLALISVGFDNRFNHPNDVVINNLEKLNISYLETRMVGSIKISLKNGTIFNYLP